MPDVVGPERLREGQDRAEYASPHHGFRNGRRSVGIVTAPACGQASPHYVGQFQEKLTIDLSSVVALSPMAR